jgi:hypothetical protein
VLTRSVAQRMVSCQLPDGTTVGLQIVRALQRLCLLRSLMPSLCAQWDTAGQDQFHAITAAYYRNADGALVLWLHCWLLCAQQTCSLIVGPYGRHHSGV